MLPCVLPVIAGKRCKRHSQVQPLRWVFEEVHADLRTLLETRYNVAVASRVRVQYGGSVKPDSAGELLAQKSFDGAWSTEHR